MDVITYSLKQINENNSEAYYSDIRTFTDEVSLNAESTLMPVVEEYVDYIRCFGLEKIREKEEYLLELLSFGILWHSYASKALAVRFAPFITMARMAEWRKKHQHIKPLIDFARGVFISLFLLPKQTGNKLPDIPALEDIDHVCKWLEATGEFREPALRFIRWRAFWGTKNANELAEIFSAIDEFTLWFNEQAVKQLGKYTQNVDGFLQNSHKKYLWREDRISCTRARSEYHLNMVGAELLNRAFKVEFDKTKYRFVLVPGCMRNKPANECKAKKVKEGLLCGGCSPKCQVNQLREMGRKDSAYGRFSVYIIPHASDLSLWSSSPGKPKRGVIASACVTTLVEGGWELKRYDVPAQCVLLDYCGCKKHWHQTGIPTSLNIRELKRIALQENFN